MGYKTPCKEKSLPALFGIKHNYNHLFAKSLLMMFVLGYRILKLQGRGATGYVIDSLLFRTGITVEWVKCNHIIGYLVDI